MLQELATESFYSPWLSEDGSDRNPTDPTPLEIAMGTLDDQAWEPPVLKTPPGVLEPDRDRLWRR